MRAPLAKNEYPRYFKTSDALLAFTGPSDMYQIRMVGTNTGCSGFSIDHYITRKMVIKHFGGTEISQYEFERLTKKLFNSIIDKILFSYS